MFRCQFKIFSNEKLVSLVEIPKLSGQIIVKDIMKWYRISEHKRQMLMVDKQVTIM